MTIKIFAHEVQSALRTGHGIDLRRSHVHEILAALFGYASHAALHAQGMLAQRHAEAPPMPMDIAGAATRAMELGYAPPAPPTIAAVVAGAAEAERLRVVAMYDLLDVLRSGHHDMHPWDYTDAAADEPGLPALDLSSPVLRGSLERLAEAENASAHLALAFLDEVMPDDFMEDISEGVYWHEQQQAGRQLAGVELEWAENYRANQKLRTSSRFHLERAAALGNAEAALLRAEEQPNDETFELAASLADDEDAMRLGDIALECDRLGDAREWYRVAARHGDTDAMRLLASEFETDLKDSWTWIYLADLLGTDVTAAYAVDDHGRIADADEAGPLYVEGGFRLEPLSDEEIDEAKKRAQELFVAIQAHELAD